MNETAGRLILVGTPIGSVDELSERAREALASVEVIACEDKRKLVWLLREVGIAPPSRLLVANEHDEDRAVVAIVEELAAGRDVAFVSDAGMPGIADPGSRTVRAVLDAGFATTVVNGPSAALAALVVSGLPTARFVVEGFLPRSGSGRRSRLDDVVAERRTTVLFEAPHRLRQLIDELIARGGGDRSVALCRELTKTHEEIWRGDVSGAAEWLADGDPRGEFVVVLGGAPAPPPVDDAALLSSLRSAIAAGSTRRDAVDDVATGSGVARNRVYALLRDV